MNFGLCIFVCVSVCVSHAIYSLRSILTSFGVSLIPVVFRLNFAQISPRSRLNHRTPTALAHPNLLPSSGVPSDTPSCSSHFFPQSLHRNCYGILLLNPTREISQYRPPIYQHRLTFVRRRIPLPKPQICALSRRSTAFRATVLPLAAQLLAESISLSATEAEPVLSFRREHSMSLPRFRVATNTDLLRLRMST